MVKKDGFSLVKAQIDKNFKDQFLIELSNLNVVHIKSKKEQKIKGEIEEKDPLREKVKDLRKDLTALYNKLEVNYYEISELKVNKDE